MTSSGFSFNAGDSDTMRDGSLDEFWKDILDVKPTVVASPDQFFRSLPDPDAGYPWRQPSSSTGNFAAAPPSLNAHTYNDVHDWPSQPGIQSAQYHALVPELQDSGLMPTVMPTTHPPSAILNAGRLSVSQGYSPAVVNGTTPVHDTSCTLRNHFSPPGGTVPSYHNDSPMFVDQAELFKSEIKTPYEQIIPAFTSLTLNPSSIPSGLAFQPRRPNAPIERIQHQNPRRGSSVTTSLHPPTRTSSLPVQASLSEEAVSHTCQWMRADGTICGAPITRAGVPKHLTIHGVEKMTNNHRVSCRWLGCRIKGNHDMLNRESMVRHVREKHLGYRRSL